MANKQPEAKQKQGPLTAAWQTAWEALQPLRSTWDEKEQALLAQANDSVSGKITATRVSDAALSTLSYERQARVSAQLPTGRVYPQNKSDEQKATLLNIVLNRYILPNADDQFDFLIKTRMWGLYASVYGSMPMFYDYRADDAYVGPTCYLVDPRCFAFTPGYSSIQEAPSVYVSTIMSRTALQKILERKTTSYNKAKVRKLLDLMKAQGAKPSKLNDATKTNTTVSKRYDLSNVSDQVEIIMEYQNDRWIQYAPDYNDNGEDFIIRDMDNPHASHRKPVVMRHCFPVLGSMFGLGDFERGMKVQKAKDSIINLFLEGAKNRVYPPLMIQDNLVTPGSIRYEAGSKWHVKSLEAVKAFDFGAAPLNEFQATYAALQGILQNMFGTSTTEISAPQGGPAMGKTPEALQMQSARENARDTWDRFMHEKATEELLEGMLNLLTVKQEKPINFTIYEEDLRSLGYTPELPEVLDEQGNQIAPMQPATDVPGLSMFDSGKGARLTLSKSDLKSTGSSGYRYLIDSNSSMKQDDQEQFQALLATWNIMHPTPMGPRQLSGGSLDYDEEEHLKSIFIAAGITDWDRILKEVSQKQQAMAGQPQPGQNPAAALAASLQGQGQPGQPPMQPGQPMPPMGAPQQPQQQFGPSNGMQGTPGQMPAFQDPEIAQAAQMMLGASSGR